MPSMCLYAVKNGGGGMRLTDIILVRLKRKKSGTRPPIISSEWGGIKYLMEFGRIRF